MEVNIIPSLRWGRPWLKEEQQQQKRKGAKNS
jgi:hypothetical protein